MSAPSMEDTPQAKSGGLFGHLSALLAAKLAYLKARLELAGLESKEAAIHVAVILALAIGALVVAVFGYLFFVIALVFLVARAFGDGTAWPWVLVAAAVLHFVGAVVLLIIARLRLNVPFFPLTLEELKKDQEWLNTNTKPN